VPRACARTGCRFTLPADVPAERLFCSLACRKHAADIRRAADNPRTLNLLESRSERLNRRPAAKVMAGTDAESQALVAQIQRHKEQRAARTEGEVPAVRADVALPGGGSSGRPVVPSAPASPTSDRGPRPAPVFTATTDTTARATARVVADDSPRCSVCGVRDHVKHDRWAYERRMRRDESLHRVKPSALRGGRGRKGRATFPVTSW
jgi:hypothetical protein